MHSDTLFFVSKSFADLQRKLKFRIIKFPPHYCCEDDIVCLIYDFEHLPFEVVVNRFQTEGGIIKLDSESSRYCETLDNIFELIYRLSEKYSVVECVLVS
jgi:hypothetical protein